MNIKQLWLSATSLKRKWLWLIASSSLILIPLSFMLLGSVETTFKKFVLIMAFSPLIFAMYAEAAQGGIKEKGSPIGNAIAMILGLIILLGVIWIIKIIL